MQFQKGNQYGRMKRSKLDKTGANTHDHSQCPACNPQIVPATAQDPNILYVAKDQE